MTRRRIGNVAFVDVFLLLLIVALALINPPVDPTVEVRPKALLTVEWDEENASDVDTHVILPTGEHMSFVRKDIGGRVVLTRDDLGSSFESDGTSIPINLETTEFFALEDGTYKIAVRMFSFKSSKPVEVTINLHTITPYARKLDRTVHLVAQKHTIPIAEVKVKDGKIVEVDTDVNFRLGN